MDKCQTATNYIQRLISFAKNTSNYLCVNKAHIRSSCESSWCNPKLIYKWRSIESVDTMLTIKLYLHIRWPDIQNDVWNTTGLIIWFPGNFENLRVKKKSCISRNIRTVQFWQAQLLLSSPWHQVINQCKLDEDAYLAMGQYWKNDSLYRTTI